MEVREVTEGQTVYETNGGVTAVYTNLVQSLIKNNDDLQLAVVTQEFGSVPNKVSFMAIRGDNNEVQQILQNPVHESAQDNSHLDIDNRKCGQVMRDAFAMNLDNGKWNHDVIIRGVALFKSMHSWMNSQQ